jgi:peptidoglycan/LPS O-acetylase OafA/YrhL
VADIEAPTAVGNKTSTAIRAAADDSGRLYFPELDGLRFIAFILVFFFHQGIPQPILSQVVGRSVARCLRENGWVGVQLFFILSGYLITTLLLREESAFGRVDLRAFWVRRVLRIWPLYYLVVAIVFLVLPGLDGVLAYSDGRAEIAKHLPWFLAFLGNWSMIRLGPVGYDAQSVLWSVCVEEQFYLAVPLIVALVGRRARVPVVLLAMAGAVATRAYIALTNPSNIAVSFNSFAQADTLLSGVLLALLLGRDPRSSRAGGLLRWLQWPIYGLALWVFSRPDLFTGAPWRRVVEPVEIWAVGVALVAVAVTVAGGFRAVLGYSRLVWLGKISYGLYMYHEVAFWLRDRFARWVGWFPNDQYLLPILGLALTVGLSAASYYAYERRFLSLKKGWTRVASRPV